MIDDVFSYNHYPSRKETKMLATELDLSTNQVFRIFQRKRNKIKAQESNSNNSGKTKSTFLHQFACSWLLYSMNIIAGFVFMNITKYFYSSALYTRINF